VAEPDANDTQFETEIRARKKRLIDSIDALAETLRTLPAWPLAF
jgi:chitinase